MDKVFELIQKTPLAQKLAMLGLVLALMVGGYYFLVYKDQVVQINVLNGQLNNLEQELQEKKAIANELSRFKKRVELLGQKLEEMKKNLPDDANMDALLKTLNELSEKSDIRIIKFVPMPEVAHDFYADIPVVMEIQGAFLEIATFFDKLAKEERIINISDISMSTPEVKNGKLVLKALCMARTFRSIAPVAVQAQASAAPVAQAK
jgi:type IV pilus assembly protein PilO